MLDFPNAPTDGQAYSAPNGLTYYYDASPGLWKTGLFNTVPSQHRLALGEGLRGRRRRHP